LELAHPGGRSSAPVLRPTRRDATGEIIRRVIDHWLLGGVTLVGGLYGLVAIIRHPAGLAADVTRPAGWWPFDLPSWRALVRIAPVGAAEGVVWGAWFIAEGLPDSGPVDAVEAVLQVLMLAALTALLAVALFNRPRILVSPPLRALPGALEEWRSRDAG
jgi:hypothetical protein